MKKKSWVQIALLIASAIIAALLEVEVDIIR